jgi:hypothetical protein
LEREGRCEERKVHDKMSPFRLREGEAFYQTGRRHFITSPLDEEGREAFFSDPLQMREETFFRSPLDEGGRLLIRSLWTRTGIRKTDFLS